MPPFSPPRTCCVGDAGWGAFRRSRLFTSHHDTIEVVAAVEGPRCAGGSRPDHHPADPRQSRRRTDCQARVTGPRWGWPPPVQWTTRRRGRGARAMGQGPGAGRDRLVRRQRRELDRLEQELIADIDLCRWFDRLASDGPPAAPSRGRRSAASWRAGWPPPSSQPRGRGVITSAVFVALVLAGAALAIAGCVLHVPTLAVPATVVVLLAPVSVLVAQGSHGHRSRRATRPGLGARPGLPETGRSRGGMRNGMEGGMWLLP